MFGADELVKLRQSSKQAGERKIGYEGTVAAEAAHRDKVKAGLEAQAMQKSQRGDRQGLPNYGRGPRIGGSSPHIAGGSSSPLATTFSAQMVGTQRGDRGSLASTSAAQAAVDDSNALKMAERLGLLQRMSELGIDIGRLGFGGMGGMGGNKPSGGIVATTGKRKSGINKSAQYQDTERDFQLGKAEQRQDRISKKKQKEELALDAIRRARDKEDIRDKMQLLMSVMSSGKRMGEQKITREEVVNSGGAPLKVPTTETRSGGPEFMQSLMRMFG